jgi:hypothetical protein
MPDFDARIRRDYRDIGGLILDCRHDGLSPDGASWLNSAPAARALDTGTHTDSGGSTLKDKTKYWREDSLVGKTVFNIDDGSSGQITANGDNTVTATLAGGTLDTWSTGDRYAITTMRFGDLYQDVESQRPTVETIGDYPAASFDRASDQFLGFDIPYDQAPGYLLPMVDVVAINGTDNNQCVVGAPNFRFRARNGSGNFEYQYGSTHVYGGSPLNTGVWFINESSSAAIVYRNNVAMHIGAYDLQPLVSGYPAGFVGSDDGAGEYLDAAIRHVAIWNRRMSQKEVDFAYDTFRPGASFSDNDRLVITPTEWTDNTLGFPQSRLNPRPHVRQLFLLGTGPRWSLFQVAASVNGEVLRDSLLDGRLFSWSVTEHPGAQPNILQDSGWSAIADIEVNLSGHYTILVSRPLGGSILMHLDVEVVL